MAKDGEKRKNAKKNRIEKLAKADKVMDAVWSAAAGVSVIVAALAVLVFMVYFAFNDEKGLWSGVLAFAESFAPTARRAVIYFLIIYAANMITAAVFTFVLKKEEYAGIATTIVSIAAPAVLLWLVIAYDLF